MGNPIKTTGKIYMNFEIDADTAYKTLLADCVKHGCIKENDETSKTMTTKLGIIGKRYGKVFGEFRKFLLDGQWNYDPEYSVDCEQRDLFGYYVSRYY